MIRKTRTIDDGELRSILINPKLNTRGQYICDCPFCSKARHFYISKETQLFDCKKCGESGSIYKLLKRLDKTYLLGDATVEERKVIKSIREMREEEEESDEVEVSPLPVRKMPVGWKVTGASTYLRNRGITNADCKRYNIGYTTLMKKYRDYVLIPIYDGGEIRAFLGRYGAKKVPEGKLRYNNSRGSDFSALLFGYDEIVLDKTVTVILVEGIFDKIKVDKVLHLWESDDVKCVCTFGKKISPVQQKKLLMKGVVNIILLYDFDALKDIKKYGLELENYFITSITYTSSKKDIDECTDEEALEVFTRLKRPREFVNDVIGKLKR